MTRSENPFGDLPEWRERRRLQEMQERQDHQNGLGRGHRDGEYPHEQAQQGDYWEAANGHSGPGAHPSPTYGQSHNAAYPDPRTYGAAHGHPTYPQSADGLYAATAGRPPQNYAPADERAYDQGAHDERLREERLNGGRAPDGVPYGNPAYDLRQGPEYRPENAPGSGAGYPDRGYSDPATGYVVPDYDPRSQITYPNDGYGTSAEPAYGAYQGQGAGVDYGAAGDYGAADARGGDFGLRPARYDDHVPGAGDPAQIGYGRDAYAGSAAPSYDLDSVTPSRYPDDRYSNAELGVDGRHIPQYGDPQGHREPAWNAEQVTAGAIAGAAANVDEDYDDDEYEDDAPQRYSWKLLAAVIVTGAVVTGGGFVLYDSFKSGSVRSGGNAPIIKANQGPSKTAPVDAGGRNFAHQDSKLLGRLDSAAPSEGVRSDGGDGEGSNRVRSVPTVRIGRDGRLILPQAPEAVAAPVANPPSTVATTNIPGINVVDSLNGSGNSGLSGLPAVVPRTEPPPVAPAAVASTPAAPIIKNRGAGSNLTTARSEEVPPVPSKSAVGSSWRMTGADTGAETSATQRARSVASIRPTIAQPIAQPVARTPAAGASTLGAGAISTASAPSNAGYVAVLATSPSRVQALQSFAELQQKHPTALQSRVPDVQRADLRSRGLGIMYRLVVGPAGPRGDANSLCASLKAEGYSGCWVKSN